MKRLVLLCSHVPSLDPRIDWVASLAAEYFETTVVGISDGAPSEELTGHPYQVYTVERQLTALQKKQLAFQTKLKARFGKKKADSDGAVVPSAEAAKAQAAPRKESWLIRIARRSYWTVFTSLWHISYPGRFRDSFAQSPLLHRPMDVVICAEYWTLAAGVALRKKFGAKLIYDAHEFAPYQRADYSKATVRALIRSERRLIRQADYAFTVNPYLAQAMMKVYPVPIGSVPNCAPLQVDAVRVDDEMLRLSGDRVKFLYQGIFAPGRGIEELLYAWKDMDAGKAVLFLRGPMNDFTKTYIKLADELGILHKSVHFMPPVSEEMLISAAMNADVGIIPYLPVVINNACCCPNKLSQYMQAGLAILAQGTCFVKDRVETYQNGLLYDASIPGSIQAAARRFVEEPDLLAAMQARSKESAVADYNWEKQSLPLRQVLESLR